MGNTSIQTFAGFAKHKLNTRILTSLSLTIVPAIWFHSMTQ